MSKMSDYLEQKLLDHTFRNTSYTPAATVYLALFTASPNDAGGGTEVSGNAYARQAITFGAAASPAGTIQNSGVVTFPTATPSGWGTITDAGIFDASSNGNLLVYGSLTSSKVVNAGDRIEFAISDLTVTFA